MTRFIYSSLFFLAIPFILCRLLWRSRKLSSYRDRLGERFGRYPITLSKSIWIHAVSVGEVITIKPLIEKCLMDYPTIPIVITTMTPTGSAQVEKLFGKRVSHVYLPYDIPFAIQGFLQAFHPRIGLIVETEIWPNLFYYCKKRNIPLYLMNARLSEKSYHGYVKVRTFVREALQCLTGVAVQSQTEADRFYALGVPRARLTVTGSLKFDLVLPDQLLQNADLLRSTLGQSRFIWIAASTHAGEEEIVLAAHQHILSIMPEALLILVPRHPDRFRHVAKLAAASFQLALRSQGDAVLPTTQVYLADTMGELLLLFAAADLAFVGGSLITKGGHNLLEPASLGKPVLTGPSLYNFQTISELLQRALALTIISDARSLADAVVYLFNHPEECKAQGARAKAAWNQHRGSLDKQYTMLKPCLDALSITDVIGCVHYKGMKKSLKDMEEGIAKGAKRQE